MEKQILTEYAKEEFQLTELSFTDEMKNNSLVIDSIFNKLNIKLSCDDYYENGEIMGAVVDLTDENKEILSECIKDFDAYDQLIDLQYHSDKKENQTDLVSLIDFMESTGKGRIRYNRHSEDFYYLSDDED